MTASTLGPDLMAKPKRNDYPVKIDAEIVRKGRIVAYFRGMTLAEYFSERLGPLVSEDLAEHIRQEAAGASGSAEAETPPEPEARPKRRKSGPSAS